MISDVAMSPQEKQKRYRDKQARVRKLVRELVPLFYPTTRTWMDDEEVLTAVLHELRLRNSVPG